MIKESSIKLYFMFFISCTILFINRVAAQKTIILDHLYVTENEKLYNMDGGEVYAIIGNDTIFLLKISQYEFAFSKQLDSLVSIKNGKQLWFLVKTPKSIYYIDVPIDVWTKHKYFKFSFFKTPDGSYRAVTFEDVSATSPAIILPNKEWQRNFYRYMYTKGGSRIW